MELHSPSEQGREQTRRHKAPAKLYGPWKRGGPEGGSRQDPDQRPSASPTQRPLAMAETLPLERKCGEVPGEEVKNTNFRLR